MADFSPTQAAFEGFRLTRERPVAVLVWAAAIFVFSLVTTAMLIGMAGPSSRRSPAPAAPAGPTIRRR
jgi:hypothetical protein